MSRSACVAVAQPPAVGEQVSATQMQSAALELVEEAARADADLVCLPEYLNIMGLHPADWPETVGEQDPLFLAVQSLAQKHTMYVALPLLECRDGARYNTTLIIDRSGQVRGRYDKTHLTAVESEDQSICRGDAYPVFDLDFGRVGVMTCYDGHFPEVARLLALGGAEIVLFPSLQRRLTAEQLELQVRCRAIDNCLWIARSSYGHADVTPWLPGMTAGKSCIVDFEGTIVADTGPRVGIAVHTIDLDRPRVKERSFGGEVGDPRDFLRNDRRPATYGGLTSG